MLLMLLVWGTRHYGRIQSHGGQYAVTKFGHFWFIPIIPLGSIWVTLERDGRLIGHDMRLSGTSVAAAYLRVWGPLIALLAVVVAGGLGGLAVASPWLALSIWSWTWWSPRGAREQRRAAWHRAAFGTSCDPLQMTPAMAASMHACAEARFREVSDGYTPADVARIGAKSPDHALAAYALLRATAAIERDRRAAREARDLGERVLDAHRDLRADEAGGPYRSAA
jgi:hypothetical protein